MNISSTYILYAGTIWFILHLDPNGLVTAVEEHNHYSGGKVKPKPHETHEQLFIRLTRNYGVYQNVIDKFLEDSRNQTYRLNGKDIRFIGFSDEELEIELKRRRENKS